MRTPTTPRPERRLSSYSDLLCRPAPFRWRALGILDSTIAFFAAMGILGGPIEGDASESVYTTWSIAHGNLACAYPGLGHIHINSLSTPFAFIPPLYSLVAGVIAAVLRIGNGVPFPSRAQLGTNCQHAVVAMFHWSVKASAILTTIHIGYIVWPILIVSALALVRACGRGRTWWEPAVALMLAFTTPVWMCLVEYFHPQDVMAMSLILLAAAAAIRERWTWCGAWIGLALATQQFALLAAIPLIVIATPRGRGRFVLGAVVAAAAVDAPVAITTAGRALRQILTGSSRAGSHIASPGGTVLWELHLKGFALFSIARLAPLLAAVALAWWCVRRLGPVSRRPVPIMVLLAASLALRLVFEENLFGYYFMAVAVSLVLLDATCGRIRGATWFWIGLVTIAWNPVDPGFLSNWTTWGPGLYFDVPIAILALGLGAILLDLRNRRFVLYKYAWLLLVLLTSQSRIWGSQRTIINMPYWGWQLILVPSALALCLFPLAPYLRGQSDAANDLDLAAAADVRSPR